MGCVYADCVSYGYNFNLFSLMHCPNRFFPCLSLRMPLMKKSITAGTISTITVKFFS